MTPTTENILIDPEMEKQWLYKLWLQQHNKQRKFLFYNSTKYVLSFSDNAKIVMAEISNKKEREYYIKVKDDLKAKRVVKIREVPTVEIIQPNISVEELEKSRQDVKNVLAEIIEKLKGDHDNGLKFPTLNHVMKSISVKVIKPRKIRITESKPRKTYEIKQKIFKIAEKVEEK
jgi:hypothetical protein